MCSLVLFVDDEFQQRNGPASSRRGGELKRALVGGKKAYRSDLLTLPRGGKRATRTQPVVEVLESVR